VGALRALPFTGPLALGAGAVSTVRGGNFNDGVEAVLDLVTDEIEAAVERAEQFGDDHAEQSD
jgi:hypothetical protein